MTVVKQWETASSVLVPDATAATPALVTGSDTLEVRRRSSAPQAGKHRPTAPRRRQRHRAFTCPPS